MSKINYCLINPLGGVIKVELTVNNGIRSASRFLLWEKNGDTWGEKEGFGMITGDNGIEDYILLEKPNKIENDLLGWNIQACAQINGANHGEFKISIYQDGIKLWSKSSSRQVNYCSERHSIFGNEVIFKHLVINNTEKLNLWKQIER